MTVQLAWAIRQRGTHHLAYEADDGTVALGPRCPETLLFSRHDAAPGERAVAHLSTVPGGAATCELVPVTVSIDVVDE